MAQEISFDVTLTVFKPTIMSAPISRRVSAQFDMAGLFFSEGSLSAGTSATLVPLGQVTAVGWAYFKNMDPTNYVQILDGASGDPFLKLTPGGVFMGPLDSDVVPYALANTAVCQLEFLIFSA